MSLASHQQLPSKEVLKKPMTRLRIGGQGFFVVAALVVGTDGEGDAPPLTPAPAALRGADSTASMTQILVFDAGSSGTRIHIFNVHPGSVGVGVPRIDLSVRESQTKKIKPGLSHFARHDDLAGVRDSITQLLDFAGRLVPQKRRATTPAILKATAGLRAVPAEQAENVLTLVRIVLAEKGYLTCDDWVDIIKGKEEAGLGWVAANFLAGTFNSSSSVDISPSIGVVEMGGGSTQVSFQVRDDETVAENDTFVFSTLSGVPYRLYAHSYMGYGQDYVQNELIKQGTTVGEDPCYPVGYQRTSLDTTSIIRGAGNTLACQSLIQNSILKGPQAPGSYSNELLVRGRFVAMENFFWARNDEALPMLGEAQAMDDAAASICARELNADQKAKMKGPGVAPTEHKNCFALSYQSAFMKALGVPTQPDVTVRIAKALGGSDIDWALGAALVHTMERPTCRPSARRARLNDLDLDPTYLISASLAAFFSTFCVGAFILRRIRGAKIIHGPLRSDKVT